MDKVTAQIDDEDVVLSLLFHACMWCCSAAKEI